MSTLAVGIIGSASVVIETTFVGLLTEGSDMYYL